MHLLLYGLLMSAASFLHVKCQPIVSNAVTGLAKQWLRIHWLTVGWRSVAADKKGTEGGEREEGEGGGRERKTDRQR